MKKMEAQMESTTDERMKMFSPEQVAEFERKSDIIRSKMSAPGALGLPPLLDARRLEWGITDSAFSVQAVYDRVLVHQIPPRQFARGTFGEGSRLVMPDDKRSGETRRAPRGIIVSAGLRALDELRTNGMELGDIVMFNIVQPWRIEYDMIEGHSPYLLVMQTGYIIGSEDTWRRLRAGELCLSTERNSEGNDNHVYRDRNGHAITPVASESRSF